MPVEPVRSPTFNSGRFARISESVAHAATNPVVIRNASRHLNYRNRFVMCDPSSIFHANRTFLMNDSMEVDLGPELQMRPQAISEKFYGTPDLWYVVMMANRWMTPMDCVGETCTIPRQRVIGTMIASLAKNRRILVKNRENPVEISGRTLVNVD